jgi:hypothetical protein
MSSCAALLVTYQAMAPARNAIDVHVYDFMLNDQLLLPLLKAFLHNSRSLHATRNA